MFVQTENYRVWALLIIAPSLAVIAYCDTFVWLIGRYRAVDSYYSHGFLIPLLSGYLIWTKRRELQGLSYEYSSRGLFILLFGLLLHIAGTFVHFFFVSGVSLFLFILGTTLFLFGKKVTKKILFPLIFLIFMIPLPLPLITAILFPMKVFVVKVAAGIIRLMEIPIYVEGFNVHFSKGSLLIGNPCSGLRSLIAFLAMGAMISYLRTHSVNKWITIIFLSFPVAFFSNILRSISLILAADQWGTEVSSPQHWFHDLLGITVFALGLSILLALGRILEWRS